MQSMSVFQATHSYSGQQHTTATLQVHPSKTIEIPSTVARPNKQRVILNGVVIPVPSTSSTPRPDASAHTRDTSSVSLAPESIILGSRATTPITVDEPQGVQPSSKGQIHKLRQRAQTVTGLDAHSDPPFRGAHRQARRYITDGETVDELLEAQWTPAVIAPQYARCIPRPAVLAENLHFVSPPAVRPRHADTRRSWRSYSMPRWSRIAMLKERLDARLGPGDFNRALYGRPKPVSWSTIRATHAHDTHVCRAPRRLEYSLNLREGPTTSYKQIIATWMPSSGLHRGGKDAEAQR